MYFASCSLIFICFSTSYAYVIPISFLQSCRPNIGSSKGFPLWSKDARSSIYVLLQDCRKELVVFCHIRHRETNNTIFSRRIIQAWTIKNKQSEINEYLRTCSLLSQLKECNLRENSAFETDTTVDRMCARIEISTTRLSKWMIV